MAPDGSPVTLVGRDYIEEEIAGRKYRLSANSFFQVNTEQAERLVRLVNEMLAPEGGETLLDLYCGVGVFGLALAKRVQQVIGIEENLYALEDAEANAQALGNVRLFAGRVEEILPNLHDPVQLVVVDPPRSGIEPTALQALIGLSPRRIAYVSCDPASLARDLKALAAAGYTARRIQPVDMFPQTYHIESITLLEK
jgi:23S rRNA (uracil1939-C5)-methyltransferase